MECVRHLDPIFRSLAGGRRAAHAGRLRRSQAELGYICTAPGPGRPVRFIKMVHNGIEYGMMAAYAGLSVIRHANVGLANEVDAETTPTAALAEHYR